MEIREHGSIFIVTIKKNCDIKGFHDFTHQVENTLGVKYSQKILDGDDDYWHFEFNTTKIILHYHEGNKDIEIYTDKKNGRESLEELLSLIKNL